MVQITIQAKINSATPASITSMSIGYSSSKSAIIRTFLEKKRFVKNQMYGLILGLILGGCASIKPVVDTTPEHTKAGDKYPAAKYIQSSWSSLPHWGDDDMNQAWSTWQKSCKILLKSSDELGFQQVCEKAKNISGPDARQVRAYFESNFQVWELRQASVVNQFPIGSPMGLMTGYFEPVLKGALKKSERYGYPLYAMPKSWQKDPTALRPPTNELISKGLLTGNEIAWVEDPVSAAFMQIQGSGKITLENATVVRLGFAGTNNQPFKSFAKYLINRGELTLNQANMQNIQAWAKKNPSEVNTMLSANPRFVFFKVVTSSNSQEEGPMGSLGVPLTEQRSIAVDWQAIPKGAPVFLATNDPGNNKELNRLVFAQDTGKAIVGGVRADYFWGTGDVAGQQAGKMKKNVRMWVLLPTNKN